MGKVSEEEPGPTWAGVVSSLGSELMSDAFRKLRLAMGPIGENLGVQERPP